MSATRPKPLIAKVENMRLILLMMFTLVLPHAISIAEEAPEQRIRGAIENTLPDVDITSIKMSPIPGVYEVLIGPEIVYASEDGRYILQGDLIDLSQRRNRSEELRSSIRSDMLGEISPAEFIEFSPEKPKHTIFVFTDIDCGYCRRLHQDMPKLNRLGIAVRYLGFPRAGLGSATHKQMESVWCSENPARAMNEAKQGMKVSEKNCENPVARHFELGRSIGVRGTPAIYTQRGEHLSGYLPPDKLIQALNDQ